MTLIEEHRAIRLTCDSTGCERTYELPNLSRWAEEVRDALVSAQGFGWSRWYGRSVRWYCPYHGPRPGHTMRETGVI